MNGRSIPKRLMPFAYTDTHTLRSHRGASTRRWIESTDDADEKKMTKKEKKTEKLSFCINRHRSSHYRIYYIRFYDVLRKMKIFPLPAPIKSLVCDRRQYDLSSVIMMVLIFVTFNVRSFWICSNTFDLVVLPLRMVERTSICEQTYRDEDYGDNDPMSTRHTHTHLHTPEPTQTDEKEEIDGTPKQLNRNVNNLRVREKCRTIRPSMRDNWPTTHRDLRLLFCLSTNNFIKSSTSFELQDNSTLNSVWLMVSSATFRIGIKLQRRWRIAQQERVGGQLNELGGLLVSVWIIIAFPIDFSRKLLLNWKLCWESLVSCDCIMWPSVWGRGQKRMWFSK